MRKWCVKNTNFKGRIIQPNDPILDNKVRKDLCCASFESRKVLGFCGGILSFQEFFTQVKWRRYCHFHKRIRLIDTMLINKI